MISDSLVPLLVEANVRVKTEHHEEDERGVEQDEPVLRDMRIVEQDHHGAHRGNAWAVATFPHDGIGKRDLRTAHNSRSCAHLDVRNIVLEVLVPNVVKLELAIESCDPAAEGVEELGKRWVYIEEVFALEIVGGEFSKVDLVEDDLVRVPDLIEADGGGEEEQNDKDHRIAC